MSKPGIIFLSNPTMNEQGAALNITPQQREKLQAINHEYYWGNLWLKGKYRKPLDVVNYYMFDTFYSDADYPRRRNLLNIKNPASFNSIHMANLFEEHDIEYGIINNLDSELDRLKEMYQTMNPKPIIGLSTTFLVNWMIVNRTVQLLRKLDPNVAIIAGGALFPTLLHDTEATTWEKNMRRLHLKAVFFDRCSEYDLIDYMLSDKSDAAMREIPNIAWFDSDDVFHVNPHKTHEPFLQGLPLNQSKMKVDFPFGIATMRSGYGCPFACAYCTYPTIAKTWQHMELQQLDDMLAELVKTKKVRQIQFIDDTFNLPVKRVKEICKIIGKYGIRWYSYLRPQYVDRDLAEMLADSGYSACQAGVESGNDLMLENMNKKATKAQIAAGLDNLKRAGIKIIGYFLIGFPGETVESANETKAFIDQSGIDFYQIFQYAFIQTPNMAKMIDKYHLTGTYTNWRHDTMDYRETGIIKADIVKSVKNVTHIDEGLCQHLMMMHDLGFEYDQTKQIFAKLNEVIIDQTKTTDIPSEEHPALDAAAKIIREVRNSP